MIIPPLRIVLSGGGIQGLAHIGALLELEELNLLKNVKEFIGVSVGSLISFALSIGFSISESYKLCKQFEFSILQNIEPLDFFTEFGIDDGKNIERFIHILLKNRGFETTLTFSQFQTSKRRKYNLRIYATDIINNKLKEFNHILTPNTEICLALRASMAIPGYFIPIVDSETGNLLVDGGLLENYPMSRLTFIEQQTALGITFEFKNINSITSIQDYFIRVCSCVVNSNKKPVSLERTILVENSNIPIWDFETDENQRESIINSGRIAVKKYVSLFNHKPIRRYSIS